MIYPDFVEWAKHMVDKEDVAIALEQAFNQGKSVGFREGFVEGKEKGWQEDWELASIHDLWRHLDDEESQENP